MSLPGPFVSSEALSGIGQVMAKWQTDPVSVRHVREYLAAVGGPWADWSENSEEGLLVPPMFFSSLSRWIVPEANLLPDGQHADIGLKGVEGRPMAGGQTVQFFAPLKIGDVLDVTEELVSITEKLGRKGPLVLVDTERIFINQRDELVGQTRFTTVFH
jgi:hydroxyacyl-ACP dehydratase HTD2-like protein with hotdog domain